MRYYTLLSNDGDTRLIVEDDRGVAMDLTSLDPDVTDLSDLLLASSLSGMSVDEIANLTLETGSADRFDLNEVMDTSRSRRRILSSGPSLRSLRSMGRRRHIQDQRDGADARERHAGRVQQRL